MTVASNPQENPEPVPWFDLPGEPAGAEGDLTAMTYHLLRGLSGSRAEAEGLTVEVFRRAQQPMAEWIRRLPTLTRLKLLVILIVREHRLAADLQSTA